jgi:serine/threonine-protein kinase HipA
MRKCLSCYQPIENGEIDFHLGCSKKIFGSEVPPIIPFLESELEKLAWGVIQSQVVVPGVQPKISLDISSQIDSKKFTLVGLWGHYILKPPTDRYPQLPEVEDLTMRLASLAKLNVAPHSLVRLASGNLAYLTKRMDRTPKGKLAMEDMCQLAGRLTEDKYRGSYEQIAKIIKLYSATPQLDLVNFYELVLFSFLTGNADMHLKNFSLLEHKKIGMVLSPAYDLVNTALVNPEDTEELALTLNGRKRKITKNDFIIAMERSGLDSKQRENVFHALKKALPLWLSCIEQSFLTAEYKQSYVEILDRQWLKLEGI